MKLIRYQTTPSYVPTFNYPNLRDEMDRLFDVAFPALSSLQRGAFRDLDGEFPADLYQTKDAFVARAELPGFRKEDISVEVANEVLTITGHQKTEPSDKKDGDTSKAANTNKAAQERHFTRAFALPENLNLDKIQASYENGVLTVTLPKSEAVKPRQVAIDVK
jgi:HSP20 family protein